MEPVPRHAGVNWRGIEDVRRRRRPASEPELSAPTRHHRTGGRKHDRHMVNGTQNDTEETRSRTPPSAGSPASPQKSNIKTARLPNRELARFSYHCGAVILASGAKGEYGRVGGKK
jgi:hypothetical protein